MRLAIGAALVLAFAGTASAATTRKVPQDYANIQAAEDACVDGDTILVSKGRYILDATVNFDVPNIKIVGQAAIVDGARPNQNNLDINSFYINAAGISVSGFIFRNGTNAIYSDGTSLVVTKCIFIDCSSQAIYVNTGAGARVEGCRFYGPSQAVESNVNNVRVVKNLVRSTGDRGLEIYGTGARLESNAVTYVDDTDGIYLDGDNAVVLKNKVFLTGDEGIEIYSNDATVTSNAVRFCDVGDGVYVEGNNVLVEKNKTLETAYGVAVYGNGVEVYSNKAVDVNSGNGGIEVGGDGVFVIGNTASFGGDDCYGLYVYSSTVAGVAVIENNKCNDFLDAGLYFGDAIYNAEIANCSATNCGGDDSYGAYLSGNGNTVENVKITNINNTGFYVQGDNNELTKCSVKNVFGDGFFVNSGNDNTFTDCTAANCGGEGFDNRGGTGGVGFETHLVRGKYRGDRNDVVNDTANGATITLVDVDKVTPGTPQSQVD